MLNRISTLLANFKVNEVVGKISAELNEADFENKVNLQ